MGEQHAYTLAELSAVLYTLHKDTHAELCGSITNCDYKALGRCVQEAEGMALVLGQRKVNGKAVRNAILGVSHPPALDVCFSFSLPLPLRRECEESRHRWPHPRHPQASQRCSSLCHCTPCPCRLKTPTVRRQSFSLRSQLAT